MDLSEKPKIATMMAKYVAKTRLLAILLCGAGALLMGGLIALLPQYWVFVALAGPYYFLSIAGYIIRLRTLFHLELLRRYG